MKLRKKIAIFLALMSLFYTVSLIQNTYAKYVTSATANTDITIAKWNILVNSQDVINNSNFSTTITPVFLGSEHIKEGVIAPTATGYFDITIDANETELSFNYDVNATPSASSTVQDIKIDHYQINGVDYDLNGSISDNIYLSDESRTRTIRFFVVWDDNNETQTMNNLSDTQAAQNGNAAIDINIRLTQLVD